MNNRRNRMPRMTMSPTMNMKKIRNPDMPKNVVLILSLFLNIDDILPRVSALKEGFRLIFFSLSL